jgi:myosin heavy subunit
MDEFIKRYRAIFGTKSGKELSKEMTMKLQCEKIISEAEKEGILKKSMWQIGLTKVFLKEEGREAMEMSMARAIK